MAGWLCAGEYGELRGASVHRWGAGEISGGGCQHIAVLRLLARAEVTEVIAWGAPEEALRSDSDEGLVVNGHFRLSNGLGCPVFGWETPFRGVEVWTDDALVRWNWTTPEIFRGFDSSGARTREDRPYAPEQYPRFSYLGTSILSFLDVVANGGELAVSGHDLRQSLEVAIAAKYSALWGSVPLKLPLEDRLPDALPDPLPVARRRPVRTVPDLRGSPGGPAVPQIQGIGQQVLRIDQMDPRSPGPQLVDQGGDRSHAEANVSSLILSSSSSTPSPGPSGGYRWLFSARIRSFAGEAVYSRGPAGSLGRSRLGTETPR